MTNETGVRAPDETHAESAQAQPVHGSIDLMEILLAKEARVSQQRAPVYGIVTASVIAILPDGRVTLTIPSLAISEISAKPVCAIDALTSGCTAAVMFEQGDTMRPLVIGPMAEQQAAPQQSALPDAVIDNERIVIEAEQEIELRCGDAAIILTRDGRILLRGAYISSHASATQRIRGGSVQIN